MTHLPPILAFGFGNLLMLGWLAAAAAPILIHLWNKRRYREMSWAAIEYLLAAMRKNSRRMRLEQWLLLAVRTLLIVLIVLAVAQPFLEQAGLAFVAGKRTLKVLVLDGSYSMAYQPTDKSRFDRAKQLAAQIVDESTQGDAFLLLLMASPPTVIVGTPAVEHRDLLEEIANLKLQHGGADLQATLEKVEQLIKQADAAGLARTEVYFLTDLGRNTWSPEPAESELADYRGRLERLAAAASLVVVDLGQSSTENLAITSLAADEPYVTTAKAVSFTAQVRNFGTQPRNDHLVEILVDGRRVKEAYIDIAAGEQAPVAFTHRFEASGDHIVQMQLGGDLLSVDNQRWLSVPVKDHVRVLCVDGKPAAGSMSGATDYLTLALNPDARETSAASIVQPEVIAEGALAERDLTPYDAIFLCNVAQFTRNEAQLLQAVVARGGGLVFFLGDQVQAERYNRELGGEDGPRVLPVRLHETVSGESVRFDPLGYRHPLARVFQGREQAGLLTTLVYKYIRMTPAGDGRARVALAFDGGDPAIVEEPLARGRVIVVATEGSRSSLDPVTRAPWTTLPVWPSYVPIVQEILALAVRGQMTEHNLDVGQVLGDWLPASASRATATVTSPTGTREELRLSIDGDSSYFSYDETQQSGVYKVELSEPISREVQFAVNVDTSESDLTRIASDDLPPQFSSTEQTNLDETEAPVIGRRSGLHRMLLYSVLGLLFFETFLAWRIGNASQ